ncbi:MAG: efflux RND transporter periplasmic adaptor subunit [Burkholderiaceae bacterium]
MNKAIRIKSKLQAIRSRTILTALTAMPGLMVVSVHAQTMDCVIQPHQIIQVGSAVPGIIDQMQVERGDIVTAGQVVATLRDQVEVAALRLAQARARSQSEVVAANKTREFADRELSRAKKLAGEKFVSRNYVDKASTDASVANAKHRQASERRELALRELEVARAQLAQRTIKSPISGVVVDRLLSPGEFVDEKPLAKIAQIDPLRVEVVVPAAYFGQIKTGAIGKVTPQFQNAKIAQATVSIVDRIVDAASNTFRVRLELPNPNNEIPPGLRCEVDLGLEQPVEIKKQ